MWDALVKDEIAGRTSSADYSYVEVTKQIPERLSLWHNGAYDLHHAGQHRRARRADPERHLPGLHTHRRGDDAGTTPTARRYSDPGIKWISYFHGGDAIHGFPRGSYGTPQSVGCVEMPDGDAGRVWPYTPIGTLVTIDG